MKEKVAKTGLFIAETSKNLRNPENFHLKFLTCKL